jgi:antirestriction protein ArdC
MFEPIRVADAIVECYERGPRIEHAGGRAYYKPSEDLVRIPEPDRFVDRESYYATLFHELAHSTGHASRLDRGLGTSIAPFGSPDYSMEELVAEMGAAFLAAAAGISPPTIEQSAAYIESWGKQLKADKKLVVQAAGAGQKAADWILGINPSPPTSRISRPAADP